MFSGLTLVTPPADEPISLAEVKQYRRVDSDDEDGLLQFLIKVARERCEAFTGRALLPQTWDLVRDYWPGRRPLSEIPETMKYPSFIPIPRPPLVSVPLLL